MTASIGWFEVRGKLSAQPNNGPKKRGGKEHPQTTVWDLREIQKQSNFNESGRGKKLKNDRKARCEGRNCGIREHRENAKELFHRDAVRMISRISKARIQGESWSTEGILGNVRRENGGGESDPNVLMKR